MGTNVISGRATAFSLGRGDETMMGAIGANHQHLWRTNLIWERNEYHLLALDSAHVGRWCPLSFWINGLTDGDWLEAGCLCPQRWGWFDPEMLPMIITASLAKGLHHHGKRKSRYQKLNAIQDLGAIDILCTDKTGTWPKMKSFWSIRISMASWIYQSLRRAYLNPISKPATKKFDEPSDYQSGPRKKPRNMKLFATWIKPSHKIDELPFDFWTSPHECHCQRRRRCGQHGNQGVPWRKCFLYRLVLNTKVRLNGWQMKFVKSVLAEVAQLNEQGLRVLGVSCKTDLDENDIFSVEDEQTWS